MKVSLNWVKKYVDLPEDLTPKQISFDLTMRTVEVEDVIDTSEKFHDIVVGKILEVKEHQKADQRHRAGSDDARNRRNDDGEEDPLQL